MRNGAIKDRIGKSIIMMLTFLLTVCAMSGINVSPILLSLIKCLTCLKVISQLTNLTLNLRTKVQDCS
jgi:hypothetical protein